MLLRTKLLIILLLLFPVHGAWAKELNLKCENKDGRMDIIIDLKKKTMTNAHGLSFSNIRITSGLFSGEVPQFLIDQVNRENIAAGGTYQIETQTFKIYRDNGSFERITKGLGSLKTETIYGNCEQTSSKKKF